MSYTYDGLRRVASPVIDQVVFSGRLVSVRFEKVSAPRRVEFSYRFLYSGC